MVGNDFLLDVNILLIRYYMVEPFFLLTGMLIALGLWILLVSRLRRAWRWSIGAGVGLPILAYVLSYPLLTAMEDFYTYRLGAPRVLDGINFPPGSKIKLSFRRTRDQLEFDGELAEGIALHGLTCAPGRFLLGTSEYGCILAVDQIVQGFHLAAGQFLGASNHLGPKLLSEAVDFTGTLAEPADVFRIRIPEGSKISVILHEETNSAAKTSRALEVVYVQLSPGVELAIHGAIVRGRMRVDLHSRANIWVIQTTPETGFIGFEGRQHKGGHFDGSHWTFED
jgi:hypothetical protein